MNLWLSFSSLTYSEPLNCHKQNCLTLNLEAAVSRALNYNRQLLIPRDGLTNAQYGVLLAETEFNIQFSPNGDIGYTGGGHAGSGVSVGGGFDISKKFTAGTIFTLSPSIGRINKHYHSNLRAVISQPLLRGFGQDYQLANLKGAQFALRSARRSLYIAQLQLITRTIQALYEVIKAKQAVKLQEDSYERIGRFYQAAKLKERIGLSDSLDVYRAEIELRHAQDDLTTSQERLQETEDVLRDMLALPLDLCIVVDVPLVYHENTLSLEDAVKVGLDNRIEVDQAEEQIQDDYRLSKVAKNNLYPELNLVLDYTSCAFDEIFARSFTCRRENKWGIGFTTSADFDPVANRIAFEESLTAIQSDKMSMGQTKSTIVLEIRRAMRQLDRTDKRMQLQAEQIKTAEGELHLSQLKFDRGMADNFNVIQAEKSLRSAQLSYWNAMIDRIIGEYQFLAAIGLLTDKPCIP